MDTYTIIMLVAMLAIFYFLLIRPENKRKKQAQQMRESLKKGDSITTIGGIMGKVVQVNADSIVFETSEDRVRIELAKWGISANNTAAEAAAAEAAAKKGKKSAEKEEKPAVSKEKEEESFAQSEARAEAEQKALDD